MAQWLASGVLTLAMAAMLFSNTSASFKCIPQIMSLTPCLTFTAGSSSSPTSSCCSAFADILQSQPSCMCEVLNDAASTLGITINTTKSLELPGLCKLEAPPASNCNKEKPIAAAIPAKPVAANPIPKTTPSTPEEEEELPTTPKSATPTTPIVSNPADGSTVQSSSTIIKSPAIPLVVTLLAFFNVLLSLEM